MGLNVVFVKAYKQLENFKLFTNYLKQYKKLGVIKFVLKFDYVVTNYTIFKFFKNV